MSKRQSTKETTNKIDIEEIFSEIFTTLQNLFNFRLIDKICRPIEKKNREDIINQYKYKFNELHMKLETVKKVMEEGELFENDFHSSYKNQERSVKVQKPIHYKNQIRKIQSKYNQLFKEGSFKHYDKVSKSFQIPINMYIINIELWALSVLGLMKKPTTCC